MATKKKTIDRQLAAAPEGKATCASDMFRYGLITSFLFALWGCQYDPHAHLLSNEKPTVADLVGVYVKDKCFIPAGYGAEPKEIEVELRADGSFEATNVPPWSVEGLEANFYGNLVSDTGHWVIERMGTIDPGGHPLWGVYLRGPGNRILPPHVTSSEGSFGLIFTIGDPDSGDAILLKRK